MKSTRLSWITHPNGTEESSGECHYAVTRKRDPDCHALLVDGAVVLYGKPAELRQVAEEYDQMMHQKRVAEILHQAEELRRSITRGQAMDELAEICGIPSHDHGNPVG